MSKRITYIRHANDDQKKTTFAHDNKLNPKAQAEIINELKSIVKRFGVPDVILLSPFRRSQDTVIEMMHCFRKHNIRVKCYVDPNLGRYFNYREQRHPEMCDKTKRYNPKVEETPDSFNKRVRRQFEATKKRFPGKNIWCITHALVINEMLENHRKKPRPDVKFLECFPF